LLQQLSLSGIEEGILKISVFFLGIFASFLFSEADLLSFGLNWADTH